MQASHCYLPYYWPSVVYDRHAVEYNAAVVDETKSCETILDDVENNIAAAAVVAEFGTVESATTDYRFLQVYWDGRAKACYHFLPGTATAAEQTEPSTCPLWRAADAAATSNCYYPLLGRSQDEGY